MTVYRLLSTWKQRLTALQGVDMLIGEIGAMIAQHTERRQPLRLDTPAGYQGHGELERVTTRPQRWHWTVDVPPAEPNPRVVSMTLKS